MFSRGLQLKKSEIEADKTKRLNYIRNVLMAPTDISSILVKLYENPKHVRYQSNVNHDPKPVESVILPIMNPSKKRPLALASNLDFKSIKS